MTDTIAVAELPSDAAEGGTRRGALARVRTPGARCAATRCSGSPSSSSRSSCSWPIWPQLFTNTDPTVGDIAKSRATPSAEHVVRPRHPGLRHLRPDASTALAPRSSSASWPHRDDRAHRWRSSASCPATTGGWLDALLSRITDIFFAIPLLLGGILFMATLPQRSELQLLHRRRQGRAGPGHPRLAEHRAPDALERPPGQAQRLRAGGSGARGRARGGSSGRTSCPTRWPRSSSSRRSTSAPSSRPRRPCRSSASGCSRRRSRGASRSATRSLGLRTNPHILFFPSLFLCLAVLAFIMLGDAVRDAFDPKSR